MARFLRRNGRCEFSTRLLSRLLVSAFGLDGLKHFTFVINSTPEVVSFALHSHKGLARVPSPFRERAQLLHPLPPDRRPQISDHQKRTVSWLTSMPRSNSRSSTFRSESGNRIYNITARRMISGLVFDVLKWRSFTDKPGYDCPPPFSAQVLLTRRCHQRLSFAAAHRKTLPLAHSAATLRTPMTNLRTIGPYASHGQT